MANLNAIVRQLEAERARIDAAIQALRGVGGKSGIRRGRRTLSAAARKRIAAAQRARWAKVKAGKK
ncbi:MAG TPA: hypothetical protein VGS27_21690 [Candidatus Sulfotelmatobacter sp.]|nr:hypothetical protein [Candidatus Sulfotelmatobacter sp.]